MAWTFPPAILLFLLILGVAPRAARATFSLCAIDRATGEAGVIVTTRVPFVGRAVLWARAGVGAVATQAWTIVEYGPQGLDLLAQGVAPQEAITRLLADDKGRERRQLGMIDMQGRHLPQGPRPRLRRQSARAGGRAVRAGIARGASAPCWRSAGNASLTISITILDARGEGHARATSSVTRSDRCLRRPVPA